MYNSREEAIAAGVKEEDLVMLRPVVSSNIPKCIRRRNKHDMKALRKRTARQARRSGQRLG